MIITNKHNLPDWYITTVQKQIAHHDSKADYSVTELLEPPRISRLKEQYKDEIREDAIDLTYAIFGSAVHNLFESINDDDRYLTEERFFANIDLPNSDSERPVTFSGQIDVYDKAEQTLWDIKVGTSAEVMKANKYNDVRHERVEQLNVYAWLLHIHNYPVKHIKNLFLVRDHRPMEQLQKAKDGYTDKIYIHEQNLWPIEVQKSFILNRIVIHEGSKQNLPYCTPEEQWRRDDKLAIMSKFQKKAHKLVDTPEQSIEWIEKNKWKRDSKGKITGTQNWYGKTWIEDRPGKVARCEDYCSVKPFCSQYRNMIK